MFKSNGVMPVAEVVISCRNSFVTDQERPYARFLVGINQSKVNVACHVAQGLTTEGTCQN